MQARKGLPGLGRFPYHLSVGKGVQARASADNAPHLVGGALAEYRSKIIMKMNDLFTSF